MLALLYKALVDEITFCDEKKNQAVEICYIASPYEKRSTNHNTLLQPTNQSTVCFLEGGAS